MSPIVFNSTRGTSVRPRPLAAQATELESSAVGRCAASPHEEKRFTREKSFARLATKTPLSLFLAPFVHLVFPFAQEATGAFS